VARNKHDDAQIYEAHAAVLVRMATVLVGPDDAPDVVSAAVVRALASPRWPTVRNPGAYLVRVVQNEARRSWRTTARRATREQRASSRDLVVDDLPSPEVMAAVRALSRRQQAVVLFTYWDDLLPADVAVRLGISEGSVKRHLARARARLREVLDGSR
jgi:RNA polymerase sigma-70 factor (ECF subfamily)